MIQSTLVGSLDPSKPLASTEDILLCFREQQTTVSFFLSFTLARDDRFVMVRSKGNVKKVGTVESMSKHPQPYAHVDSLMNLHDDSTSRRKHGPNKISLEEDNSPPMIIRSGCAKFPRCRFLGFCIVGLSTILICAIMINLFFPYPLHASCIIKWTFGDPCTYTMQKFRCQILNWSSCANCGLRGNKCLYALEEPKPDESDVIRALHFGPNLKTMETIKIAFEEINKTCTATGESASNEWLRVFDHGTNYCNLHNLVTGTGFDKSSKFLELTSNTVCTQYNMAICE